MIKTARIVSLILAALAFCRPFPASAEKKSVDIVISDAYGSPGEIVSVDISVANNPGLASLKFCVAYDSGSLTLLNVSPGDGFGSFITAPEPYACPQAISMISPIREITSNGLFARITFRIAESADLCALPITVTYDEDDVCDGDLDNVTLDISGASVIVTRGLAGDADCDGALNARDVIALMRNLVGYDDASFCAANADFNEDGALNARDAIGMLEFIARSEAVFFAPEKRSA